MAQKYSPRGTWIETTKFHHFIIAPRQTFTEELGVKKQLSKRSPLQTSLAWTPQTLPHRCIYQAERESWPLLGQAEHPEPPSHSLVCLPTS